MRFTIQNGLYMYKNGVFSAQYVFILLLLMQFNST